jgi:hypothetical protein
MALDFSSLQATPAHTGKLDFTAIGGIPAVGQDTATDDTTALGAAGRGAVGMVPMGEQAYSAVAGAAEHKPYLQERQELEKEISADKENHGVARFAGQAAGVVAPALLTGGASAPATLPATLGEAAGVVAPALLTGGARASVTLGEAAGEGALMGAGFGAGNAIDTLASGGSGAKAAGDVALGTGLGAAGGAAGQKLAGLAGKAITSIGTFAAKKAASAVGMGSDELGNMGQQEVIDTGKMLMDKGIVKPGASTQEMFDTAKALHEQYGESIGQIGNKANELGLSTDIKPILQSLDEKFKAADALHNPDERKAAIFYKRGMADILTMARENISDTVAQDAEGVAPNNIAFDQLQRLKKSYGNSAFENGAVKNQAAADVYAALSKAQKDIISQAQANPNLPNELRSAMTGYSKLYPVVSGLQDVLGRERAGNMPTKGFGMMGKLVGQMPGQSNPVINALTAMGLVGAGHPMWGIGAITASTSNPRVMANAAQGVANAIPGIAGKLPLAGAQAAAAASPTDVNTSHPALAPWKPDFQKAAAKATDPSEVDKSKAVTDFLLSQRDPAYSAAKQKAADEPQETQSGSLGMAGGGVVPGEDTTGKVEGFGSTLEGFANLMKHKGEQAPAPEQPAAQKPAEPFNDDLANQLRAFLTSKKEGDDAQSR